MALTKVPQSMDSTGSSTSKNYFSTANGDFELNVISPWSPFTTTYSAGVPTSITLSSTNTSLTTISTNPLTGTYSGQFVKTAANSVGQGFISGVLTLDRTDLAKIMFGQFSYEVVSGIVDLSGSSTQSLEIWVYNVTTAQWIQPNGYRGLNQSSGPAKCSFSFQTDAAVANNQYRVALLLPQTDANALTVNFDNFQLGPQSVVTGAIVTDPVAWVPTFTGFGTVSGVSVKSWRNGKYLFVEGGFIAGISTGVEAQMTLGFNGANGVPITDSTMPTLSLVGKMNSQFSSATVFSGATVLAEPLKGYVTFGLESSTTAGGTKALGSSFGSSGVWSFFFKVPIVGWSSNVQLSSDSSAAVVALQAFKNTGTLSNATVADVTNWNASPLDTSGTFNTTTGIYTVGISGRFAVDGKIVFVANGTGGRVHQINKNGGIVSESTIISTFAADRATTTSHVIIDCVAGDQIKLTAYQSSGGSLAYDNTNSFTSSFSIIRISGNNAVAQVESVNARYTHNVATGTGTTPVFIPWSTIDYDSHLKMSGGTYTAPYSGKYSVKAAIRVNPSTAFGAGGYVGLQLVKNGSLFSTLGLTYTPAAITSAVGANGSDTIYLLAGETIAIYSFCSVSTTIFNTSTENHVAIERVGN